jgi:hypothetical protein
LREVAAELADGIASAQEAKRTDVQRDAARRARKNARDRARRAEHKQRAAALRDACKLALAGLPDDGGMIEHNPDEGPRMFCCDGKIHYSMRADDRIEHAAGCWYIAARSAHNIVSKGNGHQ